MALPAAFRRDVELATQAVYLSWPQFCQSARVSFAQKQRGTFLIDLDQALAPIGDIPYLTPEEASKALGLDGRSIAITSRVGEYNPEVELVVTFKSIKQGHAQCVVLCDPPTEYKDVPIVTYRPKPTDATTFDQLLDVLNDIYTRADVDAMDTPSRHIWRVMEANWQINSNGFGGYFWNVGTACCELFQALDAIGSPVLQRVFVEAFSLFPGGKPSTLDDEFYAQLDAITDADEDAFSNQDSNFYKINKQLPEILWKYWQTDHPKTA